MGGDESSRPAGRVTLTNLEGLGHIWRVANGPRECSGGLGKVAKAMHMHRARMRRVCCEQDGGCDGCALVAHVSQV
eukprot:SAG31_NODE_26356_length_442_cov_2.383721_1_plen_75_part_01